MATAHSDVIIRPIRPQTITVTSLSDATNLPNGLIDLRMAVANANKSSLPTTITFDPTVFPGQKTIVLSTGVLELKNTKEPITITGPAAGVMVDGSQQISPTAIFRIDAGVHAKLTNLTVTGGGDPFTANHKAIGGGGIRNDGTTQLTDVTVTGNSSDALGGGIFNDGMMTLANVTVSKNVATTGGGGIRNTGSMALSDTTVSGNGTSGIYNSGSMTLTNVTISGNVADPPGGGGINNDGTMTLTNVTVFGNSVDLAGEGGGIKNDSGTLNIANSIIAGNTISGNTVNGTDITGQVNSFGNNLIGATNGSTGWNGSDLTGTAAKPLNPRLGALNNKRRADAEHAPEDRQPSNQRREQQTDPQRHYHRSAWSATYRRRDGGHRRVG